MSALPSHSFISKSLLCFLLFNFGCALAVAVSGELALGVEGRHSYRGQSPASTVLVTEVDFFADQVYGGLWAVLETGHGDHDELHGYLGTYRRLHPLVSADVGVLYSRINGGSEPELYLGAVLEYGWRPSLYVYRNFERNLWFAELGVRDRIPLATSADLEWYAGAGSGQPARGRGWSYLEGSVDAVFPLADRLEFKIGLRGLARDVRLTEPRRARLWGGVRLDYEF